MLAPGLDPQAALALRLVELHLERMLPTATLRALQPHLKAARKALEGKPVAKWLDKVRLISKSQPLLPPTVDGSVVGAIHEALLDGKVLEAAYKARDNESAKAYRLHPLGLVYRDNVGSLVATDEDFDDPRVYLLHRFVEAKMSARKMKPSPAFDLDKFIADGGLGYRMGDTEISVELLFARETGVALEETPLSAGQKLARRDDGSIVVSARLKDTQVFRSWLLGFGDRVEVLSPKSLRAAIAASLAAAAKLYAR